MERPLQPSLLLFFLLLYIVSSFAQSVPARSVDSLVAGRDYYVDSVVTSRDVEHPLSLAFAHRDNGVFFFTEKNSGRVRVVERGRLNPNPFVTVRVSSSGERGILGVALHPLYPDSPFVYILYNRLGDRANLVVRYRDSSSVGVRPGILLTVPRAKGTAYHNGGNLFFGPDQKLYIALAEYAEPTAGGENASDGIDLLGKILRINPDGSIPEDNPRPDDPLWSYGHKSYFDLAFDATTGSMYCTGTDANISDTESPIHRHLLWSDSDTKESRTQGPSSLSGIIAYQGEAFPRLRGKILVISKSDPSIFVVNPSDPLRGRGPTLSRHVGTLSGSAEPDTISAVLSSELLGSVTGYSDIEVGPDGTIHLITYSDQPGKILRLRPIAPRFVSTPAMQATQDVPYSYKSSFTGTPPSVSLVEGPEGMLLDPTTWSIEWTPTNEQALSGSQRVMLRASNGAGYVNLEFVLRILNVNDPPSAFHVTSPPRDTTMAFVGHEPIVSFAWEESIDPDLDTLTYRVQIDTIDTFDSNALRDTVVDRSTLITLALPKLSRNYYWRVKASDGQVEVPSSEFRKVIVSFAPPVKQEPLKQVDEFALEQNFPNPFNPSTNIKYTIPKSGHVHLGVFNLLGQEVAVVFDGVQTAGTHEVEFLNADLPSGIYFYRIQAPDFVETRKMVITK